jgi:hypothetical protein
MGTSVDANALAASRLALPTHQRRWSSSHANKSLTHICGSGSFIGRERMHFSSAVSRCGVQTSHAKTAPPSSYLDESTRSYLELSRRGISQKSVTPASPSRTLTRYRSNRGGARKPGRGLPSLLARRSRMVSRRPFVNMSRATTGAATSFSLTLACSNRGMRTSC